MLWKWRGDANQTITNKNGTVYDVLAMSPTFSAPIGNQGPGLPYWSKGTGSLTVDYRTTSSFIWVTVRNKKPIAIISFSRAAENDKRWQLEEEAPNRKTDPQEWILSLQYLDPNGQLKTEYWDSPYAGGSTNDPSPYKGMGTIDGKPPDRSQAAGLKRLSNLPLDAIEAAIKARFPSGEIAPVFKNPSQPPGGQLGSFVSGFMAYHVAWYREWSQRNLGRDACSKAGHTHIGIKLQDTVADAETAVEIQLGKVADELP
jgi:hypothetical protein